MNLLLEKQMEGLSAEQQAKKAIAHVLRTAHDNRELGWYINHGTQSFSLLTEAAATLFGEPIAKVRETFACPNPRDVQEAFNALEEIVRKINRAEVSACSDPGYCSGCLDCIRLKALRGLGKEEA